MWPSNLMDLTSNRQQYGAKRWTSTSYFISIHVAFTNQHIHSHFIYPHTICPSAETKYKQVCGMDFDTFDTYAQHYTLDKMHAFILNTYVNRKLYLTKNICSSCQGLNVHPQVYFLQPKWPKMTCLMSQHTPVRMRDGQGTRLHCYPVYYSLDVKDR